MAPIPVAALQLTAAVARAAATTKSLSSRSKRKRSWTFGIVMIALTGTVFLVFIGLLVSQRVKRAMSSVAAKLGAVLSGLLRGVQLWISTFQTSRYMDPPAAWFAPTGKPNAADGVTADSTPSGKEATAGHLPQDAAPYPAVPPTTAPARVVKQKRSPAASTGDIGFLFLQSQPVPSNPHSRTRQTTASRRTNRLSPPCGTVRAIDGRPYPVGCWCESCYQHSRRLWNEVPQDPFLCPTH